MNTKKLYIIGVVGGLILAAIIIIFTQTYKDTKDTPGASKNMEQPDVFPSWITVVPPNGLFSARFPAAPQEMHQTLPVPDSDDVVAQDTYTAEDEKGNAYFVSTAVYPVVFDPDKYGEALQSALDGMVGVFPGSQLVDSQSVDFKGGLSLEFVIQDPNQLLYQGKLLIRDRTLYQAFVVYEESALDETEYHYFLTAFEPLPSGS